MKIEGMIIVSLLDQLEVKVTNDYLNKLLRITPLKALSELIWNALDADATEVCVEFERNLLGGIEHIYLADNGHGINYDEITQQFGKLGESHKVKQKHSPSGRRYHGKHGQGRFGGFVLGNRVEWVSVSKSTQGFVEFNIQGHTSELKVFKTSSPIGTLASHTGVNVQITELLNDKVDDISDKLKLVQDLTTIFAPYLLAYKDVNIIIDGLKIEPQNHIQHIIDYDICEVDNDNNSVDGKLKVIEWKKGSYKNLYLCNRTGVAYEEENSGIKSVSFSHTAYLQSEIIDRLWDENEIEFRELRADYNVLREAAEKKLRELQRERLAAEASKEVRKLKEEKIYPYQGSPKTAIEEAERQVFDICAVKINQYLPEFSKSAKGSKEMTYRLLKEALQTNPDSLRFILKEVLKLPAEQQDELASILERTSLKSIINTTKLITDRIMFLTGLEEVLYGDDFHKRLKERSQLHKILLGELWLFGEQYVYGYDDISLKNVLKKHLQLLGRDEIAKTIDFSSIKSLNDIPDIGLHQQYNFGQADHFENLVIELKRPSCVIGQEEISQIERYAFAIEDNEYFDKEKTKWKIVLLGIKLDRFVLKKAMQDGRANGLIYKNQDGNMEVWVKEWNQVIQEAKGKHRFLKERLELQVKDNEEGLEYLRNKYIEYLPD